MGAVSGSAEVVSGGVGRTKILPRACHARQSLGASTKHPIVSRFGENIRLSTDVS
jgi:hypothetical protein